MQSDLLLFAAGLLAGGLNAAVGGGSFVSIPAMVLVGLSSLSANASSTVALLPGTLTSAWAWRREVRPPEGVRLQTLLLISLAGGLVGAMLLLLTPTRAFDRLLPWLLLLATVVFAGGRRAGAALRRRVRIGPGVILSAQVVLAVYAGYFGGGVGIMMLAVWSLMGAIDIKAMSAVRTALVSAANLVAACCFAMFGPVHWRETAVMLVAAVIGGWGGTAIARAVPNAALRGMVIGFGVVMSAAFFWRAFR